MRARKHPDGPILQRLGCLAEGHESGEATYPATAKFQKDELFGLTSQARRAAVSIPSNIAEGQGRLSAREFRYFLGQARASLMELVTQLQVAENLGYLQQEENGSLLQSCAEVGRLLNGLLASVSKQAGT